MGTTSYIVRLADHSEWQIIPSPETDVMVTRAAEIMGLEPGTSETARRLFVVAGKRKDGSLDLPPVPARGWQAQAFGYGTFLFNEKNGDVIFEIFPTDDPVKVIRQAATLLYPIIDHSVNTGGLPVHAGMLERDGRCIILPASGNTGKSTCCRRIGPPWSSPGDDLGLIVAGDEGYRLHPLPTWSDFLYNPRERRWHIEDSYEFSGIFFLQQGVRDEVLPIHKYEAAIRLFDAARQTWLSYMRFDPAMYDLASRRLLENASTIVRSVPSHVLKASLTGQFWTEIEKVMEDA